jgi:ABC-type nitrate/sulfonate/bicarbonate transport system substrate-binding protein
VEKTSDETRIVALKDLAMKNPLDPKAYFTTRKRKLATSFGGGPQYYTYDFLRHYGLDARDVEILSQRPEDMPAALQTHSVDAISIFDPFAFIAEKRLDGQSVTFSNPTLYSELYVLVARPEQIRQRPQVIDALLRALVQAATFVQQNPSESKQVLAKYTKLESNIIDGIWANYYFKPALAQQLIEYWKAEADWARNSGIVRPTAVEPDFRRWIDASFLEKVDPGAVRL